MRSAAVYSSALTTVEQSDGPVPFVQIFVHCAAASADIDAGIVLALPAAAIPAIAIDVVVKAGILDRKARLLLVDPLR